MTLNDLEWLFHDKMRFWPALLESERLNVRNSTTSAILRCSVQFTIYMYLYLYGYRRETARQLRMYAQLTRCFSAVAELLVHFAGPYLPSLYSSQDRRRRGGRCMVYIAFASQPPCMLFVPLMRYKRHKHR